MVGSSRHHLILKRRDCHFSRTPQALMRALEEMTVAVKRSWRKVLKQDLSVLDDRDWSMRGSLYFIWNPM